MKNNFNSANVPDRFLSFSERLERDFPEFVAQKRAEAANKAAQEKKKERRGLIFMVSLFILGIVFTLCNLPWGVLAVLLLGYIKINME